MSSSIHSVFDRIDTLVHREVQPEVIASLVNMEFQDTKNLPETGNEKLTMPTFSFLLKIFQEIDTVIAELAKDDKILISVRNQKLLRSCFQLVASLGFSPSLIPGLGISLTNFTIHIISPSTLTDQEKYEVLVSSTDFFTRCYRVPVLKNIIMTFHLSDYLAALIQLSFAPLKKPGSYNNITITQEIYDKLISDRQKYVDVYENLVSNCFQPILMKELLVLQSVTDPKPPAFVKRIISKEMSRRLLAPGGLLSLIRCFIESYSIDTGFEWQKIEMICKIVCVQHGTDTLETYLDNICSQLSQILTSKNTHYLATAVACVLSLNEKYSQSVPVKALTSDIFQSLDYDKVSKCNLPGTVILSPQEVEHHVNILHTCVCSTKLDWPISLLAPNLKILFLLAAKCSSNDDLTTKIDETLLKCLEKLDKGSIVAVIEEFLFGKNDNQTPMAAIEEYDAGLAIKCQSPGTYPKQESLSCLINLFMKASGDSEFIQNIFEAFLMLLIDLSEKRNIESKNDSIINEEDGELSLSDTNENYAIILQFLSEVSATPKVMNALKSNPSIVLNFIEYFLLKTQESHNEECVTIALVLLKIILSDCKQIKNLQPALNKFIPVLKNIAANDFNSILCNEALEQISSDAPIRAESECEKAITDVFDHLLPVRAHGIIELTKLIEAKDPETIAKKHYIFCLLQEQLKDPDSYIYLSAINGIAALGTHCTEDVLQVLCKEFLQLNTDRREIQQSSDERNVTELRMKIGDILVKVTKRLGEMAIVHKTLLLNTTLCGCRDQDPYIRTSALSNLAEIALVLHYRIGSIIYEVLHCIWTILETDKALECRRAAVMVITSLLRGLGKETLTQLKDNLLPIYRALKKLYRDDNEDNIVRLHAQLALDELNHAVNEFLTPELISDRQMLLLDKSEDVFK